MNRQEAALNIHKMRQYKREVTSSKKAAISALIKAGILTKDGKINKPYKDLFESSTK